MLVARTRAVREDADAWVVFTGDPGKLLSWSIVGPGTLSNMSTVTDENGIGRALYTPGAGSAGSVATISVRYRSAA